MGPASKGGIYHKPGMEDFTDNWRHQSQTSSLRLATSRFLDREREREGEFLQQQKLEI